jgi:multidrug efflux system membrane fusion protein
MKKRLAIMALVLLVVFGGLYAFGKMRERGIAQYFANNKPPPVPVEAALAEARTWPEYLNAIGTLVAVRSVTVAPEVGGRIERIAFESGQRVNAGDLLVQLNDSVEQGDLANYQAQVRLAQTNLARTADLVKRQAAAQTTLDQNRAALDQANAGVMRTEATIAQKKLLAPFRGLLGIRQADLGQYVQPGAPIVTLTDLGTLYINFTLPEKNRSQISVGQKVIVGVDAFPSETFEGTINAIDPQINADTRAIRIQATLTNLGERLLPGMFANVKVVLPARTDVVTVPETAIDASLYGDSVFVVRESDGDGGEKRLTVTRTYVEVAGRQEGRAAITRGLRAGDRVVSSGQIKLNNDTPVRISDSKTLVPPLALPNK